MVRFRLPCVILLFLLAAPVVHGALPSGEEMLARIATTQPAPVAFVVNYVEAPTEGRALFAVRVIADGTGHARIDVQDLQGGLTRSSFFGVEKKGAVQTIEHAPLWLQWWMGRPVAEIVKSAQVSISTRSLAHAGGEILWVIGAGPRDLDAPQLHIERETGLLRRVVSGGDDGPVVPARLDDYTTQDGVVTRFPKRLTLVLNRREVTLVKTWLRVGEDARIDPEEFLPSTPR